MINLGAALQPNSSSTLEYISSIAQPSLTHLDVAAAYVTNGGVRDLFAAMERQLESEWSNVRKRWVVSFDYCRSEPLALKTLMLAQNSEVRVHDAQRVLRQQCTPAVPFHPKTFLFRSKDRLAAIAGSGNLSRSGLNTGYEVGIGLEYLTPKEKNDQSGLAALKSLNDWYQTVWAVASPLSSTLLDEYEHIYESADRLKQPTPTDDDTTSESPSYNGLTSEDLRKLRACKQFWIEAGNITKNLGKKRPGNQLMMRRLSRVFFGVPATQVPQNSPLTKIKVQYGPNTKHDCSLTFSDNGMDKLTLPSPGIEGPAAYDNENLLFERISPEKYVLSLGSAADKAKWKRKSAAIGAAYTMPSSGRAWGVF